MSLAYRNFVVFDVAQYVYKFTSYNAVYRPHCATRI